MSKHSKNNNARAVFTTYERNRAQGIRQGTEKLRLGHDSMKPFDACSITLEPIANPVADLQGHLYSKNAIYDHVLEQKRLYNVQIKAYNKEQESAKVCLGLLRSFYFLLFILYTNSIETRRNNSAK